jgi:hypothetical protein
MQPFRSSTCATGEDCFVDELYLPAIEHGIPLLALHIRARTWTRIATTATSTWT